MRVRMLTDTAQAPFLAVWGAFGVFKVVTFAKDVVQLTWNVVSKGDWTGPIAILQRVAALICCHHF
jgi:hypothetical protein